MKDFKLDFHEVDFPASIETLEETIPEADINELKALILDGMRSDEVQLGTTSRQVSINLGTYKEQENEAWVAKCVISKGVPVFKCYTVRQKNPPTAKTSTKLASFLFRLFYRPG